MPNADDKWFIDEGVYGTSERASHRPQLRKPTAFEKRRLSQQTEFTFFLPFLPMAVCPNAPDVLAEFCNHYQKPLTFVHWELDMQLIPSLIKAEIDTSNIFGIEGSIGREVLNFARGVILQDQGDQAIYRLLVQKLRLLEPGVSMARSAEKILADQLEINIFCVQSATSAWYLQLANPPTNFKVIHDKSNGDLALWGLANRFWNRGDKSSILEPEDNP